MRNLREMNMLFDLDLFREIPVIGLKEEQYV